MSGRRRLILRPEVPGDLLDIHDYLARSSTAAAERFLHHAQVTLERVVASPGIGSPKRFGGKLRAVRSWAIEGFPNHLIYYKRTDAAVVVLAILHGARDVPRMLRERRP